MGAETSCLKDFTLGQPYISNADSPIKVTVYPASNALDSKKYTVFQYPKDSGKLDEGVEKHLEVLRTIRHPHILKYVTIFEDGKQSSLVTEHVVPLDVAIERQEKDEIFVGLYNTLEAIIFLHERGNICHNGINVSSVYVTDNGDWKLAAFESSVKIQRLAKQSYQADIVGFGEFALSVLEYMKDESPDTLSFMRRLQEDFVDDNNEVLGSLKSLYADKFFRFPFMEVVNGLKNLPLKSSNEKEHFFRTLEQNIHASSSQVVCRKCVPQLFSNVILLESSAQENFLGCLFSSGNEVCIKENKMPLFDKEYFVKYCLPCIYELYQSKDTMIRLLLMKYLPLYVDCIDKTTLQDAILPELLIGLQDESDTIVASSFKSLSYIVPILGGEAVVGVKRETIFYDRTPDFSRCQNVSEKRMVRNVADVMSPKSSSSKILHSDLVTDEKRARRLEREKQREEQRLKREDRRKEREARKMMRSNRKQSSDDASTEQYDILESPYDVRKTQNEENSKNETEEDYDEWNDNAHISDNAHIADDAHGTDDHSEPDWEGFEAFSNHGSDDSETKTHHPLRTVSPVTPYSQMTVDNYRSNNLNTAVAGDDAWANWDEENADVQATTIRDAAEEKKQPTSGGLVLTGTKKITPKNNKDVNTGNKNIQSNSVTTTSVRKSKSEVKNSLGDEYDIKINVSKTSFSEPDYFADMLPSVENISTNTIKVERQEVSSKFQAVVSDAFGEEASGWGDDDDGGGWDDEF